MPSHDSRQTRIEPFPYPWARKAMGGVPCRGQKAHPAPGRRSECPFSLRSPAAAEWLEVRSGAQYPRGERELVHIRGTMASR